MNEIIIEIWKFIRGDLTTSEFEQVIYYNDNIKSLFDEDLYLKIISNDFRNKDSTYLLKQEIKNYLKNKYPRNCKCIERNNLSIIGMGSEDDDIYFNYEKIKDRGNPYWWLFISKCKYCNEYWLIAQEERHNDDYCLFRLDLEKINDIINNDKWPNVFDKYEDLLKYELNSGSKVRFLDPFNSSLIFTIEDLAKENPGISVFEISKLLNLEIDLAIEISKEVVNKTNVNISF